MAKKLRKIYLHLDDPKGIVRFELKDLRPQDMKQGASHAIEFRHRELYTRIWVNIFDMKLRRDLKGLYLTDFRTVEMSDKVICTRALRDEVSKKRPEIRFCQWRDIDDDY